MNHSANPAPLVRIDKVSKIFARSRVLNEVTLEIPDGVIWGLTGPNESGKTTLLKCIFGFYRPDRGRILVDGKSPGRLTRRFTSYCPETESLYDYLNVRETIRFVSSFYHDWDHRREKALVDLLDIDPGTLVRRLSKGERGRLKLLLALARRARLILLDEPLAGFDPLTRIAILRAIVSEFRGVGQSILLSTHEVREAEAIFDRIVVLEKGSIIQSGPVEPPGDGSKKPVLELLAEASSQ